MIKKILRNAELDAYRYGNTSLRPAKGAKS
jgi:hypothetical protein